VRLLKKILIVEDEVNISMVLKAYLTNAGYEVRQAYDGVQALTAFEEWKPALVLLDVMLPEHDGWEILSVIRERSACPVIMLTALGDIKDKLLGLTGGADDYLSKPFIGEEVVARVQAVIRRLPQVTTDDTAIFGSLKIDYAAHRIYLHGRAVHLTPRDLSLLLFLSNHPNQTFDRDHLLNCVWGMDYDGSDRAVDLSVKRIRQALAEWPPEEGDIMTIRGLGYQFCVQSQS
jgi:DNA-binding response OmpR family regulator